MGNTSVVATGVKNQGDGEFSSVYKLVDLKGGGELVDLMKRARWTKNFKEIDEKIQTAVKPFLYEGGRGKKIPICEIVEMRNKERQNKAPKVGNKEKQRKAKEQALLDMKFQDHEGNYLHNKPDDFVPDRKFRDCCWDITKRGTVGDQILHLCLLNASAIHYDLAKRLIQQYPKLINDIYLGDEYYGESVLHIAIVNEDPAMVKFILDHGGDYHERACGNFFCPDDQKDTREDSYDHEWVEVSEKTNYEGYVYFGEYPLSFAACLGQEECVRLLIAKGANPNLQDTNGNTVMHMLVIHDKKDDFDDELNSEVTSRKDMFDLLLELGARLDIKNRQGLTPLTLAAVLARKSMYEHILEKIRQVMWIYGKVTCAGYPLKDIDTISETGEINKNSVLNLVVYGEDERHLDMMDGLIVELLKDKWKTFVRFRFYRRFVIFFMYFIMFMVAFILRPGEDKCPTTITTNSSNGVTVSTTVSDSCYLLKACSDQDYARFALEIMILIGAVWYIFIAMKEIYHQGFRIFFNTLKAAPAKTMFLMSCVFVIMMLPGRAACKHEYEDIIGTFAILFTAPYFLFFCRGFKIVGPFVVMIYRMVMGDLLRWFIIYAVFIVGFSQSMYIIFRNKEGSAFYYPMEAIMAFYLAFINSTCDPNELPCVFDNGNPLENMLGVFSMNVGEFEDIYATFEYCEYPHFMRIVFAVYMIMVTLLLVNMLIAMMGNTYQLVNETQKEYFRQWAKIVLVIEQSVTTNIRKQQRLKYSQPMADGDRAFIIRWHQSALAMETFDEEILQIAETDQFIQEFTSVSKFNKKKHFIRTRLHRRLETWLLRSIEVGALLDKPIYLSGIKGIGKSTSLLYCVLQRLKHKKNDLHYIDLDCFEEESKLPKFEMFASDFESGSTLILDHATLDNKSLVEEIIKVVKRKKLSIYVMETGFSASIRIMSLDLGKFYQLDELEFTSIWNGTLENINREDCKKLQEQGKEVYSFLAKSLIITPRLLYIILYDMLLRKTCLLVAYTNYSLSMRNEIEEFSVREDNDRYSEFNLHTRILLHHVHPEHDCILPYADFCELRVGINIFDVQVGKVTKDDLENDSRFKEFNFAEGDDYVRISHLMPQNAKFWQKKYPYDFEIILMGGDDHIYKVMFQFGGAHKKFEELLVQFQREEMLAFLPNEHNVCQTNYEPSATYCDLDQTTKWSAFNLTPEGFCFMSPTIEVLSDIDTEFHGSQRNVAKCAILLREKIKQQEDLDILLYPQIGNFLGIDYFFYHPMTTSERDVPPQKKSKFPGQLNLVQVSTGATHTGETIGKALNVVKQVFLGMDITIHVVIIIARNDASPYRLQKCKFENVSVINIATKKNRMFGGKDMFSHVSMLHKFTEHLANMSS